MGYCWHKSLDLSVFRERSVNKYVVRKGQMLKNRSYFTYKPYFKAGLKFIWENLKVYLNII